MTATAAQSAAASPADAPVGASLDPADVARFEALAAEWWDPRGKFAPLHAMNPLRVGYARDRIATAHGRDVTRPRPLAGLAVADVACGGGLSSEPLARLGAAVTAVDAAREGIGVARLHAEQQDLDIDYRVTTAEALAEEGRRFDAVIAFEIVEHVADVDSFLGSLVAMAKPGAPIVMSTLNRTARSFALGIVAAEYILGLVPRGTHSWRQFRRPSELAAGFRRHGARIQDVRGMVLDPVTRQWRASDRDLAINYLIAATAP
jgi:2-polyprenyl-6-hydroxyphenyl methylase/3-demethylubiquinone-9 3-methyltransferase